MIPDKINNAATTFAVLKGSPRNSHPPIKTIANVTPIYAGNAVASGNFVTMYNQANEAISAAPYAERITGSLKNLNNCADKLCATGWSNALVLHFTITWLYATNTATGRINR